MLPVIALLQMYASPTHLLIGFANTLAEQTGCSIINTIKETACVHVPRWPSLKFAQKQNICIKIHIYLALTNNGVLDIWKAHHLDD